MQENQGQSAFPQYSDHHIHVECSVSVLCHVVDFTLGLKIIFTENVEFLHNVNESIYTNRISMNKGGNKKPWRPTKMSLYKLCLHANYLIELSQFLLRSLG